MGNNKYKEGGTKESGENLGGGGGAKPFVFSNIYCVFGLRLPVSFGHFLFCLAYILLYFFPSAVWYCYCSHPPLSTDIDTYDRPSLIRPFKGIKAVRLRRSGPTRNAQLSPEARVTLCLSPADEPFCPTSLKRFEKYHAFLLPLPPPLSLLSNWGQLRMEYERLSLWRFTYICAPRGVSISLPAVSLSPPPPPTSFHPPRTQ